MQFSNENHLLRTGIDVTVFRLWSKYSRSISVQIYKTRKFLNGIDAFFPILQDVQTRQETMTPENAAENLSATAEQVFRLINI
ncbi:MAG: glycerate kinase [Lachnospiraceae bacterium]|nr:glycerate kinase [Lachnospiraceae bacterium]